MLERGGEKNICTVRSNGKKGTNGTNLTMEIITAMRKPKQFSIRKKKILWD